MYKQLEALKKMGPLKQVMGMLPMGNVELPSDAFDVTSAKMDLFKVIMDSMTSQELDNPTVISGSRVHRIALGSGTSPEEVRELIKYYKTMQRMMKGMRGGAGKFNMQRMMKKFGGM
jgi:signal recognition particle subunit SRP54